MKPSVRAFFCCVLILFGPATALADLKAGAAVVDVTPEQLPVLVNGGMLSRSAEKVKAPIHARAIVLHDGHERLAIVVVDSCMMSRPFLDEAKRLAAEHTKIRPDRILISATHTHSAPSCVGALGTEADPNYPPFLREKLAEVIAAAEANLEPARVGWAVADAHEYTALRRWIRRPDRIATDPFGNPTVRANMHAGRNWDDVTGESGPEDPDLSLIAFQSKDGRPIALLANFSMHYFGDQALSPDYYGLFCEGLEREIAAGQDKAGPAPVGIMSHGCSGDIWRRDYTKPASAWKNPTIEAYAAGLVDIAAKAYRGIEYRDDADLAMAEARLQLDYRLPDAQLLDWAQRIVEAMGDRPPKSTKEVYAREQIILHERQAAEIVVQAVRVGEIGIATTPNETYALTGLKIKLQSPLPKTMVIELANGGDGYIPPPEQLLLGGYNTWPARSAGLEVQAEPKIVGTALGLLEEVARQPRRVYRQSYGPACTALLEAKPVAYWRMDEFAGPRAVDATGRNLDAFYEPAVAYFLEGPRSEQFCTGGETNRAVHFAGGRLRARIGNLVEKYSISLWLWNGMPADAREVTGWLFSRGHDHVLGRHGDHLGVGGTSGHAGKLIFQHGGGNGGAEPVEGRTQIERWTWNHVVFTRDGETVKVYLNADPRPEIETRAPADFPAGLDRLFFGGRCDNASNWEGRLDEIAVFDVALSAEEVERLAVREP